MLVGLVLTAAHICDLQFTLVFIFLNPNNRADYYSPHFKDEEAKEDSDGINN